MPANDLCKVVISDVSISNIGYFNKNISNYVNTPTDIIGSMSYCIPQNPVH